MRPMNRLSLVLLIALLTACAKEVEQSQLVYRRGICYEINSTTPFTGTGTEHHENGQLKSKETYSDGKLDGVSEFYYENGHLEGLKTYKHNKLNGVVEAYNKHGRLLYKGTYNDDK